MALTVMDPRWEQSPVKGVLFDMDGVILDTEKLYTRFWLEAAQVLGYPMTLQQALGMRSLSRQQGKARLESYFGPDTDYYAVRNKRIELMEQFIDQHGVEEKPGIRELLEALKQRGIPCAVTTSSPRERIEKHLGKLGLLDQFDRICTGYEVPKGKPEPDIYLHGAAAIGIAPQSCIALEDSPAGIASAYRAGCMCIMVPDQDLPDEISLRRVCAVAESLKDIIPLL